MSRRPPAPLDIRSIRLWWYLLALPPLLALGYLSLAGALPPLMLGLALFLLLFWVFSFGFAAWARLRKRRELRQ